MIGWLGNFFILLGIILIAYHLRIGFIFGVIGNTLWCIKGISISQYDLVTIEIIIVVLQLFSYWNWERINVRTFNDICKRTIKQ